ncbi:ferritin [Metallumcola ferriviriculae]|uniref:Ferritin n=1 Tax=Metallumcola ferriviriculae TaxID=3039180 RepID=A0AAU0UR03_9FIRM|nr:ferritin [Desulfitibacteraceae bacterium MK1]
MFSGKLLNELNEQIKWEFYSAQYYLAMAAYCASEDLRGFENFFLVQAEEERFHAMKFYNFINEMGGRAIMKGFEDPNNEFSTVTEVFQAALKHEQFVTQRIYKLMDLATEEREHATISVLKWFIDEQVEEESTMNGIVKKLQRFGEDGSGIMMLDNELSQRAFTPPVSDPSI